MLMHRGLHRHRCKLTRARARSIRRPSRPSWAASLGDKGLWYCTTAMVGLGGLLHWTVAAIPSEPRCHPPIHARSWTVCEAFRGKALQCGAMSSQAVHPRQSSPALIVTQQPV